MLQDNSYRVRVESLDWQSLFPFLKIVRSFRMAIHPSKMLLAMLMVVLTYLSGLALDEVWGPQVYHREFNRYITQSPERYQKFLSEPETYLGATKAADKKPIFQSTLDLELQSFKHLIYSAASLKFGFNSLYDQPSDMNAGGVVPALYVMIIGIPGWLLATHPTFLAIFLAWTFILTIIFGGSISRLASLHATRDLRPSCFYALRYIRDHFLAYFGAPAIPLVLTLVIGLLLAAVGLLFNFAITGFVSALIFGLLIFGGFIIALLLIGLAGASNIMFPAISTDASDPLDTISRTYNYVLTRPWQYLFYTAFSLFYGAITYLFIAFIIFLTLWATKNFTGWWVFTDSMGPNGSDMNTMNAILPDPKLGQLPFYTGAVSTEVDQPAGITIMTTIVTAWVKLLIAIIPAFAFSFYFCAQTWVYLLLRESADGTEIDQVHLEPGDNPMDRSMDQPDLADNYDTDASDGPSSQASGAS
ncbi:hypothetical protein [Poriferisphaera sp. WC338]|uniref:hypothetical protein n=1 Tax=Poriferisphaera sp. WC338 TaxID=3425129 RepID=UPI003D8133C4